MEIVGHTLHTIELCLLSDTFTQIRYQLLSPYLVEDLVFFFFFFLFGGRGSRSEPISTGSLPRPEAGQAGPD